MGANWKTFTVVPKGRFGYGQVEPTHLSGQRTSQIYASLPANENIDQLENGQFVYYDYAQEEVSTLNATSRDTTDDLAKMEPMLVWNEIKLYDEREQMYKDYAMIKSAFTPGSATIKHDGLGAFAGQMTPRVMKTNVGDVMIMNTLKAAAESNYASTKSEDEFDATYLAPNADGFLEAYTGSVDDAVMVWQVDKTKDFTMPDGQPAVKIQRIK
jgi:hypothetical protein